MNIYIIDIRQKTHIEHIKFYFYVNKHSEHSYIEYVDDYYIMEMEHK